MFSYPEALNAMHKIAVDLFATAKKLGRFPAQKTVHVRVQADPRTGTASVDWNDFSTYLEVTIYMPVMPASHRMTDSEFQKWAAYLYHEVGHPLWTDKNVWLNAVQTKRHNLLNALEDVREEKRSNDAGMAANGKAVLTDLVEGLMTKAWADGYDPNEPKSIGWTMSYMGRAVCNGYKLDTHGVMAALDPNGPVAMVLTWAIPELGACKSTQDCLDLADKIVAALPKHKPGKQPKEGQPGQPGKGKPKEGQEQPKEGQEGQEQPKEGQEGQEDAQDAQDAQDAPVKDKSGKGGKAGESLSDADIEVTSLAPQPKEVIHPDQTYDCKAVAEANVIEAIRQTLTDKRKRGTVCDGYPTDMEKLIAITAKATRQRALLARALRAADTDDYEGSRLRGRLDRKAFARKAAGSKAIFGRHVITEGYETDVAVVIDGSGSMAGTEIHVATQLAMVIAQASAQVGVNCDVAMFGRGGKLVEVTTGKTRPNPAKFAGVFLQVGGGSPLCVSLLQMAKTQAARGSGKRKILFAITDGACNMGINGMIATVAYIEKAYGIEVANLMIGTPVTKAFTNEISVKSTSNVCEVGLDQITRQLEKGARP